MDLLQYIGSIGGIGAVFGLIAFTAYRQAVRQMRDDRKYAEDRLTDVLDAYNKAMTDNTRVNSELVTWLKAKNGR